MTAREAVISLTEDHQGWVAVDLDGTLAIHETGNFDPEIIGEPVPRMVQRVKEWVDEGRDVRIFTARVSPQGCLKSGISRDEIVDLIEVWCEEHLGVVLPVTHEKDTEMGELWDDRCVSVVRNTGERTDGLDS